MTMDLHVVFEPDEQGWVRATIEELPGVITCAPTLDEARELVRDALDEWLQALPPAGPPPIGARAPADDEWYLNLLWIERGKCLLLTHAGTLFRVFVADVRKADLLPIGA